MEKNETQKIKFYLGTALMVFPLGFFIWSSFPGYMGMVAATATILFICGGILLFTTILDMKFAEIEIRIVEEREKP
jgi:hypothetical protein